MSGKSQFVMNLLTNWDSLYPEQPIRCLIVLCGFYQDAYGVLQDKYRDKCAFATSLSPELLTDEFLGDKNEGPAVFVLDDVAHKIHNNPLLTEMYIGTAHHKK